VFFECPPLALSGHDANRGVGLAALSEPGKTVIARPAPDQCMGVSSGEAIAPGLCHLNPTDKPLHAYRLGGRQLPSIRTGDQAARRPRVAVMPLTLQSGGTVHWSIGEIISDEVTIALSRTPELQILSRLSTTVFRGCTCR
jgi:hypothetical protein